MEASLSAEQTTLLAKLEAIIARQQLPHAQLLIDNNLGEALTVAIMESSAILEAKRNNNNPANNQNLLRDVRQHPDLYFLFPIINTAEKNKTQQQNIKGKWYEFIANNTNYLLNDWAKKIALGNKAVFIGTSQIDELKEKIYLNPFYGKNKVVLVWAAETLNMTASNKLLKLLEEPPKATFFLLVATNETALLPTIVSRCQIIRLNPVSQAKSMNNNGSKQQLPDEKNENHLLNILRASYRLQQTRKALLPLMELVEKTAMLTREDQKNFLSYTTSFFREMLIIKFGLIKLRQHEFTSEFEPKKLVRFINENNIEQLVTLTERSYEILMANANPKILFTNLFLDFADALKNH